MDGARAVLAQRRDVFSRAIPLVARKPILRVQRILLDHVAVARHLGQNGGGGNRVRQRVAVDERMLARDWTDVPDLR